MLSKPSSGPAHMTKPEETQLFVWQTSIMLLNVGIVLFIIGLAIQIVVNSSYQWSPGDVKGGFPTIYRH